MKAELSSPQDELTEPKDALPPVSLNELPDVMQKAVTRA